MNASVIPVETSWVWSALVDGGAMDMGGGVMGTPSQALEIATGGLGSDGAGALTTFTSGAGGGSPAGWTWTGAERFVLQLEVGGTQNGTLVSIVTDGLFVDDVTNSRGDGIPDYCDP